MSVRAVVLLSGGLDSMLAVRILQRQGIEVEALNFRTTFTCCQDQAAQAAEELGVRLTVVSEQDDYLDVVRHPRHGYGRGANPCLDCRIYMFRIAARWMRESGAALVASGEVVGQRPMSQKKRDLALIAHRAGLTDRLVRPLSARLLPVTAPERELLVDRQQLYGISGRGRSELIALAREFGLKRIPQPSNGCALTEPGFAAKVHDLLGNDPEADRWHFELL
ncbi:MAG: 7-cyano-7-deazaguanine synthase, partial [Singulisphaera sp.]